MAGCPSCGRENPDDARYCSSCGAELRPAPGREVRKIVTVLFADVVGSTALGEATDPEALRARMRSYFEDLRAIVERHGGVVEKFIGDAVMAVFGIPASHEDDALRAVRAAAEMREAVLQHGLEARIGVNTGEVVVGGGDEALVVGDAVNIAARLEHAAPPGGALIGAETRRLVRDAVLVELVEPLELKGKSEPVEAYRLIEVRADAEALLRHLEAPLVGRVRERERLRRDFEDAVAERTCRLFTLLGPAGIGKSRLVAEFLEGAEGDADVLHGRCLHYGDDITYWPLVEILLRLGVDPDDVIGTSREETRLAFRRLLEARAAERPQVVVLDDLQWAEPTFIDLVEHVADLSRGVPIFLLCVARTELLDIRPGWGGGKLNATSVLLEPLADDERAALIANLSDDGELVAAVRSRIAEASGGNPLFVEEMVAMVRERGADSELVVPSTIQALLQARLDLLEADERVVIERGAVEGQLFHRGSLRELAPEPTRGGLETHLSTLVRKDLIRPDRPTFAGDDAFRFRHLLIRDAAYESLPKATRAELHERFAEWLSHHDLVERDEILGYHLERAYRYRGELDAGDPRLPHLGGRAGEHLAAAGNAAMDRGDWAAARGLLGRARSILPPGDERRAGLAPELAQALQEVGSVTEARAVAEEARDAADPVIRARGAIAEFDIVGFPVRSEEHIARRDEALAILEEAEDHLGLAQYWRSRGFDFWTNMRSIDSRDAWERGLEHAVLAGAGRIEQELQTYLLSSMVLGPTPVEEAIERAQSVLDASSGSVLREAAALRALGQLRGFQGRAEEGRELVGRARQAFREAGLLVTAAGWAMGRGALERRAGDLEAEERALREACDELERLGDRYFLPTVALELADCICHQDAERDDEIRALCELARETTTPGDLINFVYLDGVEGFLAVRRGDGDEGLRLARRGLEAAQTTDAVDVINRSSLLLCLCLAGTGRMEEAASIGAGAIAVAEEKGDVAGAAWIRRRLAVLGVTAVP
jgi:class 3 adenylate cyclase/tetratricopeptide (TPR) repeat protein